MMIQGNQAQPSHRAPETQSGVYLGRDLSLPSPEHIQQGDDQYTSRYGITANASREQTIDAHIMGLRSQYYDEITAAFDEQRESLPKPRQDALPGEPQVSDFVKPNLEREPDFDPNLIEFYVRRDAGSMDGRGRLGTPTELRSWTVDSERVYERNRDEIKREYETNYPKYQKAHAEWLENYIRMIDTINRTEQLQRERARKQAETDAYFEQKAREKEYVDEFNKNWSDYYGEKAKTVEDVNRITYGAKQSFQAAEQRIYEQRYNDTTFSNRTRSPADKAAAATYEFGIIASDAAKSNDLDHIIGLQQPLHAAHAALPAAAQIETRRFVNEFDTNVAVAKIDRKNQLEAEKYRNEFRQELRTIGFSDDEIARVEQVAQSRQKPATFGDQFTRRSYEQRLTDFIQKHPESKEYLTTGGSIGATARFMGEGLTSRGIAPTSREVIEVGGTTYYLTRYGLAGYEVRNEYGQIVHSGRGAVSDEAYWWGMRPLYFANTLTPKFNPMYDTELPRSAYGAVDVSDIVFEIQTKKTFGYDVELSDTSGGIDTTPAWKDVEAIQGIRKQIDAAERSFLEQPTVKTVVDTITRFDADPLVQPFTNPAVGMNPFDRALKMITGKSTHEYIQPFVTDIVRSYTPKSIPVVEQPNMQDRGNQYKFLRGIPIGLTVGTLEMLATIRAAGEYGLSEVKRGGVSTLPPMVTASVTTVATGIWEGYKADPAGFTGEFIGVSKGMGAVTGAARRAAGAAVVRTGQATGIVRGKTLMYLPKTGQNVPYASKSWMVSQILENEFISGARGVTKPIQNEYSPEFGYRRSILTRDPGAISDTPTGATGFFMTISDKHVDPVSAYFLTKGGIFDKLQGGSRIYILDDIRTVRLPETTKQRIYERINEGRDFGDIYDTEIIPRAVEQHRATGEPIAVPSPKRARMSTEQPELEAFVVADNLSPGTFITDQSFAGFSSTGAPISRIRIGSQSKLPKSQRGFSTWVENLGYNWDIGYGMGRFYNKNYLRSMATQGYWKDLEIFERSVPGYHGEYESHGFEHSVGVAKHMRNMVDTSPTLRYLTDYEGVWLRSRYHDITKIVDHDPRVPYPHAWAAGEAIRTEMLSTPTLRRLSPERRNVIARDIAQHTDITPEWNLAGLKTRLLDRPSPTSKALANADRLDLVRFGGHVVVDAKKLFRIREDPRNYKVKQIDMRTVKTTQMSVDDRIAQYKQLELTKEQFKIEKQKYRERLVQRRRIEQARASENKISELDEYLYKQRRYRSKPYGYPIRYKTNYGGTTYGGAGTYSTTPYGGRAYGYSTKGLYRFAPYTTRASGYPNTTYPAKPYPARTYPVSQYPVKPYPAKPYPGTQYPGTQYPVKVAIAPPTPIKVKLPDVEAKIKKRKNRREQVSLENVTNVNIRLPKAAIFGLDTKNVGNVLNPDKVTKVYVNGVLKQVKKV